MKWKCEEMKTNKLTFLNITSEITAEAVKSAAMIIIIMPTGILSLRPVRDEIHPLKNKQINEKNFIMVHNTSEAKVYVHLREHF